MTSDGIAIAGSGAGCVGEELRMGDLSKEHSIPRGAEYEYAASTAGQGAGISSGGSVKEA